MRKIVENPGDDFDDIKFIAKGTYGKVYVATEKITGTIVALKRINLMKSLREPVAKEIETMKMVKKKI